MRYLMQVEVIQEVDLPVAIRIPNTDPFSRLIAMVGFWLHLTILKCAMYLIFTCIDRRRLRAKDTHNRCPTDTKFPKTRFCCPQSARFIQHTAS